MLARYADNKELFERCITLMDSIFPGIKKIAVDGIKYGASWPKVSIPFIKEIKGEIVGHLGIMPLDMLLEGKAYRVAGLHGICVKPEHREQGIFKELMREALAYIAQHFDSALLFTDQADLYEAYHFKILAESDFLVAVKNPAKRKTALKKLNLNTPTDLALIEDFSKSHLSLSQRCSIKEHVLFILNSLEKNISYSQELNMLMVYEVRDETLYIQDILQKYPVNLSEIIKQVPEAFESVILQFVPDQFTDCEYTIIPAKPECFIMVADNFPITKSEPFRYLETYRC